MLLAALAPLRVVIVGGKGGVGKTSVASSLAYARARQGERVLVVSTDPAHSLGHLWQRHIGDDIARLWAAPDGAGRLDGVEIDPGRTVDRHLAAVRRTMERLLPERLHRAARDHLERARHAPGTHESATLERVAEMLETGVDTYDAVILDTAPSGHTLHLLALPEQLTGWTESLLENRDRSERYAVAYGALGGTKDTADRDAELRRTLLVRKARFSLMRDLLHDTSRTGFVLVLVAEPLPAAESFEVAEQLVATGIPLVAVIANRLAPADIMPARRAREESLLATLDLRAPVTRVPLVDDLVGIPAVEAIAAALAAGDDPTPDRHAPDPVAD